MRALHYIGLITTNGRIQLIYCPFANFCRYCNRHRPELEVAQCSSLLGGDNRMLCNGGVQSRQFTEPEQVTNAQGGVFCQVVPAGPGPFEAALHAIRMGDVTLNMGQVSACMGLLRTVPDRALLQLPLEGAESLVLNTVPYRPG